MRTTEQANFNCHLIDIHATGHSCNRTFMQQDIHATEHSCNRTFMQQNIHATEHCNRTFMQQDIHATEHSCNRTFMQQDIYATGHSCNRKFVQQDIHATRHPCNRTLQQDIHSITYLEILYCLADCVKVKRICNIFWDAGTTGAVGAVAPVAFCTHNCMGTLRVHKEGATGAQKL